MILNMKERIRFYCMEHPDSELTKTFDDYTDEVIYRCSHRSETDSDYDCSFSMTERDVDAIVGLMEEIREEDILKHRITDYSEYCFKYNGFTIRVLDDFCNSYRFGVCRDN